MPNNAISTPGSFSAKPACSLRATRRFLHQCVTSLLVLLSCIHWFSIHYHHDTAIVEENWLRQSFQHPEQPSGTTTQAAERRLSSPLPKINTTDHNATHQWRKHLEQEYERRERHQNDAPPLGLLARIRDRMVEGPQKAPVRTRPNDKVIFFVHIHKSAGSLFCQVAHHSNLSVNHRNNCNVQSDQRCCGLNESLAAQTEYAQSTPYDLVAAEMPLYAAMDYHSYNYVVILRDSRERYFSHWKHIFREHFRPGKKLIQRDSNSTQPPIAHTDVRQRFMEVHEKRKDRTHTTRNTTSVSHRPLLESPAENQNPSTSKPLRNVLSEYLQRKTSPFLGKPRQRPHRHLMEQRQEGDTERTEEPDHGSEDPTATNASDTDFDGNHTHSEGTTGSSDDTSQDRTNSSGAIVTPRRMPYYNNRRARKRPPSHMMHPSQQGTQLGNNRYRPKVGANFTEWWKHQPDNWNMRQICGSHCHGIPKYQLSLRDWEYTLQRLSKFHTVLFQEELQESVGLLARRLHWPPRNLTQVQAWSAAEIQAEVERGLRRPKLRRRVPPPTPSRRQLDDWDPFMSALDDAMYEIAHHWERHKDLGQATFMPGWKESLSLDLRETLERYFEDTPFNHRHQCTSECCTRMCSAW